jgi:hypothetical protein
MSEYGESEFIARNILLPSTGFYLDLGCAWPVYNSNTHFLRQRWWGGMAVDANPEYANDWKELGNFVCAVVHDGTPVSFEYLANPDPSHIGHGVTAQSVTLDVLTKDCPPIDFISCDLEGSEYEALSRLDWSKHRPGVIISEHTTFGRGKDMRVHDLLVGMGYNVALETVANYVFHRA